MPEKLKDMFFTESSLNDFGDIIKNIYPEFEKPAFLKLVFNKNWDSLELKKKMRHTTLCLSKTLPDDYIKALNILKKAAPYVKGFEAMVLPDYVEVFGIEYWELSLPALGYFTKYSSSEFAIRPFLVEDPDKVMVFMSQWAEDSNENVRRFASEGCRPRLPWAMALPQFKKNPGPIIPILEKLKDDDFEFVRRSVANNLNDISKDNPDIVLEICERWYGQSHRTDWIIKHCCRSLLKAGNKRALMLFGYGDPSHMSIEKLALENTTILIGEYVRFSFQLVVAGKNESTVRLEYGIDYVKANGKHSRKIFKITENTYSPGYYSFSRKHSFANMTTRKHYKGNHNIAVIINGKEKAKVSFEVKN